MKTKVRKSGKKRKSLKKATKNATKKATKKTTKRQKKLLNYKNRNTRKNKKGGGDMTLPIIGATAAVITGASALSYITRPNHNSNINNKSNAGAGASDGKYKWTNSQQVTTTNNASSISGSGSKQINKKQIKEEEKKDSFNDRFNELLSKHGLEQKKIEDNGDCLFTALLNILKKKNTIKSNVHPELPKTVSELRKELVKWMGKTGYGSDDGTFLDDKKEIIISEINPETNEKLYNNIEDYKRVMSLNAHEKKNYESEYVARSGFGGQIEVIAFMKKYEDVLKDYYGSTNIQLVQVVKKDPIELQVSSDFGAGEITTDLNSLNKRLPILLFKDLHYDMITPKNED